jgi:hypothetical protein
MPACLLTSISHIGLSTYIHIYTSLSTHIHHLSQLIYSGSSAYLLTFITHVYLSTYIYHLCQLLHSCLLLMLA